MPLRTSASATLLLLMLSLCLPRPSAAQEIWTWGANYWGQLGDGTTNDTGAPIPIAAPNHVIAVAAGAHHTLALKQDGTVWSWGNNDAGQLGDGTYTERHTPQQIPNLTNIVAISMMHAQNMALKSDGTVYVWGGTCGPSPWTPGNLDRVTAIAAGVGHFLALKSDGTVWAWGSNNWGNLGNGTNTPSDTPTQVPGLSGIVAIAAGSDFSLALTNSGYVWSWGLNFGGECGNGTTYTQLLPGYVNGLTNVVAISAGFGHSLALKSDHSVWGWGENSDGQLGDGTTDEHLTPIRINGFTSTVKSIKAGSATSFAILQDGTLWAWGQNDVEQLGVLRPTAITPTRVQVAGNIGAVAGGVWHSIAIRYSKIPTRITTSSVTTGIGQSAALKATLLRTDTNAAISGQIVQFSIDGVPVATGVTSSTGAASASYTVPTTLSVATHALTAALIENQSYYGASASANITVSKGSVAITVPAVSATLGSSPILKATLKTATGVPIVGRSVTFKITVGTSTTSIGTATTDSTGTASVNYGVSAGMPVGSYSITAAFNGDTLYLAGSGKGTLTVSKVSVSVTVPTVSGTAGSAKVLTATLKSSTGSVIAGRSIAFKVTIGTQVTTVGSASTDSSGVASVQYKIPTGTKVGTYSIGATFSGDSLYLAATGTGSLIVK